MDYRKQFIVLLIFANVALASVAQSPMQQQINKEIQQAAAAMREAGMSEEQINQFLQASQHVLPAMESASSTPNFGMSMKEAAMAAPIMEAINQSSLADRQKVLQQQIEKFEKRTADRPNTTVTVDGKDYDLRIMGCHDNDAYGVDAAGPPVEVGEKGPQFTASRGWQVQTERWIERAHFRISDDEVYQVDLPPNSFDGKFARFSGVANVVGDENRTVQMSFNVECVK